MYENIDRYVEYQMRKDGVNRLLQNVDKYYQTTRCYIKVGNTYRKCKVR